jgi:hypothetical protein
MGPRARNGLFSCPWNSRGRFPMNSRCLCPRNRTYRSTRNSRSRHPWNTSRSRPLRNGLSWCCHPGNRYCHHPKRISRMTNRRSSSSLPKRRWNRMLRKWRRRKWKWIRTMVKPTNPPLTKVVKKASLYYHIVSAFDPPPLAQSNYVSRFLLELVSMDCSSNLFL